MCDPAELAAFARARAVIGSLPEDILTGQEHPSPPPRNRALGSKQARRKAMIDHDDRLRGFTPSPR